MPVSIGIKKDVLTVQGNYITYKTGTETINAFKHDDGLSVRYLAVSGDVSASYAVQKSFRRDNQYAFYSFNSLDYTAILRDYADLLNEKALLNAIEDLPTPFNGSKAKNLHAWKNFFESFGSHVVISATYGTRYQLVSRSHSTMYGFVIDFV